MPPAAVAYKWEEDRCWIFHIALPAQLSLAIIVVVLLGQLRFITSEDVLREFDCQRDA